MGPRELVALSISVTESWHWIDEVLSLSGFSVLPAKEAFQGVRLAARHLPAIIVLAGATSSPDLSRIIQDLKIVCDAPVLVAGSGEPARVVLALESGADLYVDPSMTPRELEARIHAILRRYHRLGTSGRLRPAPGPEQ